MIAVILLVLVYTILAICMLCTVLGGRKLGLFGVLMRVGVVMTSGVLAFAVVKLISPVLLDAELSLLALLGLPSDLLGAVSAGDGARALIGILTGGILSPFLFTFLAIFFMIAGTIVVRCTAKKLPKGSAGGGMGVGALQGLLLALVILFPILSVQGLLVTAVEESPTLAASLTESLGEDGMQQLDTASRANVPHLLFGGNAVKWTVKGMTATRFEGTRADVYVALNDLCAVVEAAMPLSEEEDLDLFAMTPAQNALLEDVFDTLEGSALLSSALADIVSVWSEAWSEGDAFMDMESPEKEATPILAPVYRKLFSALAQSDRENVVPNIRIMLNALSAWSAIDGETDRIGSIKEILDTFGESEEMEEVAAEIKVAGMWAVAQDEIPALEDKELYDEMVGDVLGLLDGESPTVEAVAEGLDGILMEHDYELTDEELDGAAEVLVDKRNELGRPLTEEELADLCLTYMSEEEQS